MMPPTTVRAVCLDLGNVLAFHDDALLWQRLATLAGREPTALQAALQPLWPACHKGLLAGDDLRAAINEAAGLHLSRAAFMETWNCHFRIHHDVLPLVESLLGRVKLLLLSNTNAAHFDFLRPQLPLLAHFDHLILSYQLGAAKPEPAIFHEALRRADVPPESAVFFDDVPAYVDAARGVGMQARRFIDAPRFARDLDELGLPVAG